MSRIKLFIPLLIFIALASVLYWGLGRDPNAMPSALVGRPVPAFSLPELRTDSGSHSESNSESSAEAGFETDAEMKRDQSPLTEQLFIGQVSLLNVWATWCPSCRIEHPYLIDLAKLGVPIIGLNYKDEDAKARRWLTELGDPYKHVIVDQRGSLGLDLGVFGAPETYLIDSTGMIRFKHVGVVNERVWQNHIAPLYQALGGGYLSLAGEVLGGGINGGATGTSPNND